MDLWLVGAAFVLALVAVAGLVLDWSFRTLTVVLALALVLFLAGILSGRSTGY